MILSKALLKRLALDSLHLPDFALVAVIDSLGLLLFAAILWNVLSLVDNVGYLSILPDHVVFFILVWLVSSVGLHELHVAIVSVFV